MRKRKGFYSISVVAKMFEVHQQTIRMYEKEGLITPKRSAGNTRLFSEEDVDRLEEVIYLTHKLGVNLAGVEMILKLQKKIKRMQDEMNRVFKETEGEFEQENQSIRDDIKKQAERLVGIRRDNASKIMDKLAPLALPGGSATESVTTKRVSKKKSSQAVEPELVQDDFEIEYDKDG